MVNRVIGWKTLQNLVILRPGTGQSGVAPKEIRSCKT
jgi:hypothetical protein